MRSQPRSGKENALDSSIKQIPIALARAKTAYDVGQTRRAIQYAAVANELAAANVAHFAMDMAALTEVALQDVDLQWRSDIGAEFRRNFMLLGLYGENCAGLHNLAQRGQSLTDDMELQPQIVQLIYSAKGFSSFQDIVACGATYARQKLLAMFRHYESHLAKAHADTLDALRLAVAEGKARTWPDYIDLVGVELAHIALACLPEPSEITVDVRYTAASLMNNFVRPHLTALMVSFDATRELGGDYLVDADFDVDYDLLEPIIADHGTATFYCISPVADTSWMADFMARSQRTVSAYYGERALTIVMTPPDRAARTLR